MASSSSNVVGVHYRVGKKIGEGSFGVIFEGTNLLNNQQVAIKFVSSLGGMLTSYPHSACFIAVSHPPYQEANLLDNRSRGRATHLNCEMNTGPIKSSSAAVSQPVPVFRSSLLVMC